MTEHVIIAGGSRGIGAACAALYVARGARVSVLSRSQGLRVDLRDAAATLQALDQAEAAGGAADLLICTAGAARQVPVAALTTDSLRDGIESKYFTYANVMLPMAQRMAARGGGVIVPVIGTGGRVASATHLPGGTANAALMLLVAGLARAYGGQGVRVTGVSPGPVATERLQQLLEAQALQRGLSLAEVRRDLAAAAPLGQIPEAGDMAALIALIAEPAAALLNGTTLTADGGALGAI